MFLAAGLLAGCGQPGQSASAPAASASESVETVSPDQTAAAQLPDGSYTCNVTLEGGSGLENPTALRVEKGEILAVLVWNSLNYDYRIANYGKNKWALSTYQSNPGILEHYVIPQIGKMKLKDITPRMMERFYQSLLTTQTVRKCTDKKYAKYSRTVALETIKRVHKLLHSCVNQAVRWELVDRNPVTYATPPESQLLEDVFYNHREPPHSMRRNDSGASGADAEMIAKLLGDPQTAQLLRALLDKIS